MILITSTGELLLYFTVIFFSFHIKKKKKRSCCRTVFGLPCFCCRNPFSVDQKILKARLSEKIDCDQMEEGEQYSEYLVERNPRSYMSMRDYRNLTWQWH